MSEYKKKKKLFIFKDKGLLLNKEYENIIKSIINIKAFENEIINLEIEDKEYKDIACSRVIKINSNEINNPLPMEIEYEKKYLFDSKKPIGIIYDGNYLQYFLYNIFFRYFPEIENNIVIYLTNQHIGTFEELDKRYHLRMCIYGKVGIISTTGIVSAPAKPKEYYVLKQMLTQGKKDYLLEHKLKKEYEQLKDKCLEENDDRLYFVIAGLILQYIMYNYSSDIFCKEKDCYMSNAHWQEELINIHIKKREFCNRHKKILTEIKQIYN